MNDAAEKSAYDQLKARERRFVDYIVQGDNGATAARKIAKKSKRPDVLAAKIRAKPLVQKAIEERQVLAMEDAGITNAQILLGLAQYAGVDPRALVWQSHETPPEGAVVGQPKKLHELDDVTARCIQSLDYSKDGDIKVRFVDRLGAKKLLGQYKRLFTETHQIDLGEKTLEQLVAASMRKPEQEPQA